MRRMAAQNRNVNYTSLAAMRQGKAACGCLRLPHAASVLHTTNRKLVKLVVVVHVYVLVVVVHVPILCVAGIVLRGAPPVAVVAGIVEIAIRNAVAARQGRKSIRVFANIRIT